ncbi:MAG: hypothetical protein HY960_05805 [Ignavibacteriae bacterium]|nr:hypothetical protein [Ignavibacteriota bacterium]
MKLLAQHGYAEGTKIYEGLEKNIIDGVIFSPKDIRPENLIQKIDGLLSTNISAEIYFDPQVYAAIFTNDSRINLGKLIDYNDYFLPINRNRLEIEKHVIEVLRTTIKYQLQTKVTGIIGPNILISRSLDSREAAIARSFIRLTKQVYSEFNDKRPVYATIAVSKDALVNLNELQEFLNDITFIEYPPDGFYILVATKSNDMKYEIFNTDVIAGWMLINYSFKINGFKVINGYSDLLSPFLGAVGGDVGATGWWSNLRTFSMERFLPSSSGGRMPILRYLSVALFNRITIFEYQSWRRLFSEIVNGLSYDETFNDPNIEPERSKEVLQNWEALKKMTQNIVKEDVVLGLKQCEVSLDVAQQLYDKIRSVGLRPETKSNDDHLESLKEGIREFRKLAEL